MIVSKFCFSCIALFLTVHSFGAPVPSPIEVILHRLSELEERCKALEEQCLNLQQGLDTLHAHKEFKGSPSELQEEFQEHVFTLSPSKPPLESKNLSEVTLCLKKGDIHRAILLLDYFINEKNHPLKAQALYYKGLIYMHQKKYSQADTLFSTAYLHFKNQPKPLKSSKIHQERNSLFPIQILLRSAECLNCLGKQNEALFVCEEIKRGLHKIPVTYHKKIIERIHRIITPVKRKSV